MGKADKRWWFRLVGGNEVESNYLVYATCEKAARQPFDGKVKITYAGRASWRSMCQLTGCIKPPDQNYSELATGFLLFNCNSQVTVMYPNLAEGTG